jgi:hypothetical protein
LLSSNHLEGDSQQLEHLQRSDTPNAKSVRHFGHARLLSRVTTIPIEIAEAEVAEVFAATGTSPALTM